MSVNPSNPAPKLHRETDLRDAPALAPSNPYVITEEGVRVLIDKLAAPTPKRSRLYFFLAHPLVLVLAGSIAGAALTYYYTNKQKDLEYGRAREHQEVTRRQSVLDGINNSRVPKLGELWERLDADDVLINRLLEERQETNLGENNKKIDQIIAILRDDRVLVSKNRFWLGEDLFTKTDGYLDSSIQMCLDSIDSPAGGNLSKLRKRKDAARQDIIKIRDLFLEGESPSEAKK